MLKHRHDRTDLFALVPQLGLRFEPQLEQLDHLLDDDEVLDLVRDAMARRSPRSRSRGRPSTPVEVILRMLVVMRLYGWSYEQAEYFVNDSLVLRQFCRVYLEILVLLLAGAACKKTSTPGGPSIASFRTLSQTDTANITRAASIDSTLQIRDTTYKQVFLVAADSTVVSGQLGHQYAILGSNLGTLKTITINGVSNPILPGLVTNTSAIFSVASNIPFGSTGPNNFVITTSGGTTSTTWPIQQPPPVITSINPQIGNSGDTMTITGTLFNGATRVTFDSTQATIISQTLTQIKVTVPPGVVQAFVYVFTPGGAGKSPQPFGFKSIIYVNGLQNGWGNYTGYNSTLNFANVTNLVQGEVTNIRVDFQNAYGALQIGYGGVAIVPSAQGLTQIKFSIYGGVGWPVGQQVQVVLNGDYGDAKQMVVVAGQWTTYSFALSALGNPSPITEFVIQGYGVPVPSTMYVTDIGFI